MFAAIRHTLVRYAKYAGATDPEDVAHDIIVKMLQRPNRTIWNAGGYLRVAARNGAREAGRKTRRMVPLTMDWFGESYPQNDDAQEDIRRLVAAEPDLVAFLIEYSETRNHGGTDRARASRGRRKLREVLAT